MEPVFVNPDLPLKDRIFQVIEGTDIGIRPELSHQDVTDLVWEQIELEEARKSIKE